MVAQPEQILRLESAGTDICPVKQLRLGHPLRESGLCDSHICALMELGGNWPPVLVWMEGNQVIDGAHRVVAARRLGLKTLAVLWFRGTEDEAYVESVRRNSKHGLPLTSSDRIKAVNRILEDHPDWSDRRISDICAVAAKTVARARLSRRTSIPSVDSRIGRDGKSRPLNPAAARERILRILETEPGRSLRSVATAAGATPETVRSVRNGMRRPRADRAVEPDHQMGPASPPPGLPYELSARWTPAGRWGMDAALISWSDCKAFASWFQSTAVQDDSMVYVPVVPLSRVYEIADEARSRADFWVQFARDLEARVQRSPLRA